MKISILMKYVHENFMKSSIPASVQRQVDLRSSNMGVAHTHLLPFLYYL